MFVCSKRNKAAIPMSTMCNDRATTGTEEKPEMSEMVLYYSEMKYGVAIIDKWLRRYETHKCNTIWPLYRTFQYWATEKLPSDVTHIASNYIVSNKTNNRRLFLRTLSEHLWFQHFKISCKINRLSDVFRQKSEIEKNTEKKYFAYIWSYYSFRKADTGWINVVGVRFAC